jgi:hypothetical protein
MIDFDRGQRLESSMTSPEFLLVKLKDPILKGEDNDIDRKGKSIP